MMSERRYYHDSYGRRFTATVSERLQVNGRTAVVLDQTYFYPTSGGQPFDRGRIDATPVINVTIREDDGAILHWLGDSEIVEDQVTAEIDWQRRFDHMQQHSGQHILSQAFIRVCNAETVGFHLSDDTVTIDLDSAELTAVQLDRVELLSNQIIWQNRPVTVRMVEPSQVGQLPLRKAPPARSGKLRLIEIDEFDLTACGGTHVSNTGEIGIVKILKLERRGERNRVEFCCGQRALHDYHEKNNIVNELTAALTTGQPEIVNSISRLQEELKQARRTIKRQQAKLLEIEAEHLLRNGQQRGRVTVVTHVSEHDDPSRLRALSSQLTQNEGVIALLGIAGPKAQLLFSRSQDAPGEMNRLLEPALRALGSAAGGGTATVAQGGGPAADREAVTGAIRQAEQLLLQEILASG